MKLKRAPNKAYNFIFYIFWTTDFPPNHQWASVVCVIYELVAMQSMFVWISNPTNFLRLIHVVLYLIEIKRTNSALKHIFGGCLLNQWNRYFFHLWYGDQNFEIKGIQTIFKYLSIRNMYLEYYEAKRITLHWVKFVWCLTFEANDRKRRLSAWIGCARTKNSIEIKFIEHMFDTINIHSVSETADTTQSNK